MEKCHTEMRFADEMVQEAWSNFRKKKVWLDAVATLT